MDCKDCRDETSCPPNNSTSDSAITTCSIFRHLNRNNPDILLKGLKEFHVQQVMAKAVRMAKDDKTKDKDKEVKPVSRAGILDTLCPVRKLVLIKTTDMRGNPIEVSGKI